MSGNDSTDGDAEQVVVPALDAPSELERLSELDIDEHPDVYQRIHAQLQGALASIDDA
jgi:hypothetical protein